MHTDMATRITMTIMEMKKTLKKRQINLLLDRIKGPRRLSRGKDSLFVFPRMQKN